MRNLDDTRRLRVPKKLQPIPIQNLGFSDELTQALAAINIQRLGDLENKPWSTLTALPHFRALAAHVLRQLLAADKTRTNTQAAGHTGHLPFAIPAGIKHLGVGKLRGSVRIQKALAKLKVNVLGDLNQFTPNRLLRLTNFSHKSLTALTTKLAALAATHCPLPPDAPATEYTALRSVVRSLDDYLNEHDPAQVSILKANFGGGNAPACTTRQIGKATGKTRQRIEQLLRQTLHNWVAFGGTALANNIAQLNTTTQRDCVPISRELIAAQLSDRAQPWGSGFYLGVIAAAFSELPIWWGTRHVSAAQRFTSKEISTLLALVTPGSCASKTAIDRLDPKPSTRQFYRALAGTPKLHLDLSQPQAPRIHAGRLLKQEAVRLVLEQHDQPQHISAILSEVNRLRSQTKDAPVTAGIAKLLWQSQHIYCLGPQKFGTLRHFLNPPETWAAIQTHCQNQLATSGRLLATAQVISTHPQLLQPATTTHELAEILRHNPDFQDLGHHIFALKSAGVRTRPKIKDLLLAALTNAAQPLSAAELLAHVRATYCVSAASIGHALHRIPNLCRTKAGYLITKVTPA